MKHRLLTTFLSASLWAAATQAAAPALTGGAAAGPAGSTVILSIGFNPGSNSVSALQFDLVLPPTLSTAAAAAGAIVGAAGKSVSENVIGNHWRFVVYGLNQNTLEAGTLVTVSLAIDPSAVPGALTIPIAGAVYSTPAGVGIPGGTNPSGVVTVTYSPGSIPTPQVVFPPSMPVNGSLVIVNFSTYAAVTFEWTFTPTTPSAPVVGPLMDPLATFQPSAHGVSATAYVVSVVAVDALNNKSSAASGTVSFGTADLSQVKVFPNPWRKDKHSGQNVQFTGLPAGTSLKIFTVSGRLVSEFDPISSGQAAWDTLNDQGEPVASGIYFYLLADEMGQKDRGRLTIIR